MHLSDKKVAVVGNASSLLLHEFGAAIDTHDIVVRMNRGVPRDALSQGTRTDLIVFSVFPLVSDIYQRFNAKAFMWMSPKRRDEITPAMQIPPNMTFYDVNRWQALSRVLGSRPSIGAMTLDFLTAVDPVQVSIFGFDFKRSGTNYQSRQHIGPHDYKAEERFCMELSQRPKWNFLPC